MGSVGVAGISVGGIAESVPATMVAIWSASDKGGGCGVLLTQALTNKAIMIRLKNFLITIFLAILEVGFTYNMNNVETARVVPDKIVVEKPLFKTEIKANH